MPGGELDVAPLRSAALLRDTAVDSGPPGADPRVLVDGVWATLLWAGLNLTAADLPGLTEHRGSWYPPAMVRALVVVGLFAG